MRLVACPGCHAQFDVQDFSGTELRCHCGEIVPNVVHAGVDVEVHRCGSCGALIAPDAERCDWCRSAIVRDQTRLSLICPECYARNADDSRFCTGCGVEFRPQLPVAENQAALTCPCCDCLMRVRGIGGVAVYECGQCLGLWVPGDHFDELVNRAIEAQRANPSHRLAVNAKTPSASAFGKVVYRRCPVCSGTMQRKNFGRRSGVIIDWCGQDGTWLDAEELPAIAAFILSGGFRHATDRLPVVESDARLFRSAKLKQIEAMAAATRTPAPEEKAKDWWREKVRGERGLRSGGVLNAVADLLEDLLGW